MDKNYIEEDIFFEIPRPVIEMKRNELNSVGISHLEANRTFYDTVDNLATYFKEHGYAKESMDDDELKYIISLAINLSRDFDYISSNLILSVIANESGFDRMCTSKAGARGVCQIIPKYHCNRLMIYTDSGDEYDPDMFYNVRLNILTGMDYLSQILQQTEGDIIYAMMWYNQGAASANDDYVNNGIESKYARKVVELAEELEEFLWEDL